MKLIVGLGNPGPRYFATRHNVGRRIVESFAHEHGIALTEDRFLGRFGTGCAIDQDVALLLPDTFMNASGRAVAEAVSELPRLDPATDLIVAFDDLDLPTGRIRLRKKGGGGGHRGMQDIIEFLDRRDFARLRFGIGRPRPDSSVIEHVLSGFDPEQSRELGRALAIAVRALEAMLRDGVEIAMNSYNRDE
jgi:PTH1 family peptidyl-tRNA hydrolase